MSEPGTARLPPGTALFLIAALVAFPAAFFARIDNWFGIGRDIFSIIALLAFGYALLSVLYFSADRGKTKGLLIAWLTHLQFWMMVAPFFLILYYGHVVSMMVSEHYARYAILCERLRFISDVSIGLLLVSGVIFIINLAQASIRGRRASR